MNHKSYSTPHTTSVTNDSYYRLFQHHITNDHCDSFQNDLPPTKPIDVQFIGYLGLVQSMEDAVVHELDPVYHPLELQEKRYKQHSKWGGR